MCTYLLPDIICASVNIFKMVYSYQKLCIQFFFSKGLNPPAIFKCLEEEYATRQGILKFIKKFKSDGTIGRKPGSGRKWKVTAEVKTIVEEQMKKDDETTASQLHALLNARGHCVISVEAQELARFKQILTQIKNTLHTQSQIQNL